MSQHAYARASVCFEHTTFWPPLVVFLAQATYFQRADEPHLLLLQVHAAGIDLYIYFSQNVEEKQIMME